MSFVLCLSRTNIRCNIQSSQILFAGVVFATVLLFVPVYINVFKTTDCGVFETIAVSVHNMIRLFVIDADFEFITSNLTGLSVPLYRCYSILFSVIYLLAPFLTFNFILSFFKNVSSYKSYYLSFRKDIHIFSELNEKSLNLAKSILGDKSKKKLVVFSGVDSESNSLVADAESIDAVLFNASIENVNFTFSKKKCSLSIYIIPSEDSETDNLAINLIDKFKSRDNTRIFAFTSGKYSDILFSGAINKAKKDCLLKGEDFKLKIRRVNEIQSLIYRNLYSKGYENLFVSAKEANGESKEINALIVGLGTYGTEMLKALSWYCQMDGYLPSIYAIDIKESIKEQLSSECPELLSEVYNNQLNSEGDARYNIVIKDGLDVRGALFDKYISGIKDISYVFVCLGNDELNLDVAIKLRTLYGRRGLNPVIQTVFYDEDSIPDSTNLSNFKGQSYEIDFIGNIKKTFSVDGILFTDIEKNALERHLKWGNEEDFWLYDYNYRSSIASVIHKKAKIQCSIPGADKEKAANRSESELMAIRLLEHRRWNAYMRSEGYIYSGSSAKESRNDLLKMHNCLVPFGDLPLNEQIKDDD
jgi:hypothetical protein